MDRGYLAVLEGSDAVGKTSLLRRIESELRSRGLDAIAVDEFSGSDTGDHIRQLLDKGDTFLDGGGSVFDMNWLLMKDLAYQVGCEIEPHLKEGRVVLKDRYVPSMFAYQIPKVQQAYPGCSDAMLFDFFRSATGSLPKADLTLLLTLPEEMQMARIAGRGEDAGDDTLRFLNDVNRIYGVLGGEDDPDIVVFENDLQIDVSVSRISDVICDRLERCGRYG